MHMEAEHNGSTSNSMVGQRATQLDNLFEDCKALIVGRSWCKLVRWMEQWAATADDDWQQGKGTSITPTPDNSTLASNRLLRPLLDGRQGKTASTHQNFEVYLATGWDTDKSKGDGSSGPYNDGKGGALDKAKAIRDGATHPIHQRDQIHPSNTSLSINCVCLHPSEATPIPKDSTPPPGESLTVSNVNVLVNGNSPSLVPGVHAAAHPWRVGGCNPVVQLASKSLEGLQPPILAATGNLVTGADTNKLRLQNKRRHQALQDTQLPTSMWTKHSGSSTLPPAQVRPIVYRNKMCPAGIAMAHPTGDLLAEWSQLGFPTKTGRPWSKQEMWEAVAEGPHQSSLLPEALAHFAEESVEKVQAVQAKLVLWDDIKDDSPTQLNILPIAAITHKLKALCFIFDLSSHLWLKHESFLELVNDSMVKLAPQGALDQLGHALSRIIHAFTKTDDNVKIFMAKWDIKDGF
jgi:hypothetical protein